MNKPIRINILRLTDAEVALLVEALSLAIGATNARNYMQQIVSFANLSTKIQTQASSGRRGRK